MIERFRNFVGEVRHRFFICFSLSERIGAIRGGGRIRTDAAWHAIPAARRGSPLATRTDAAAGPLLAAGPAPIVSDAPCDEIFFRD